MYPARELTRLATHKLALQREINRNRNACAKAATQVMRPVASLDRMLALWRRLAPLVPLAALPLGFLLKRSLPRPRALSLLLRWGPQLFTLIRSIVGARKRSPHND